MVNKCLEFCQTLVSQQEIFFNFLNRRLKLLLLPGQQEGVNQPGNQEGDQPQEADAQEKAKPLSSEKKSQEEARLPQMEV